MNESNAPMAGILFKVGRKHLGERHAKVRGSLGEGADFRQRLPRPDMAEVCDTIFPFSTRNVSVPSGRARPALQVMYARVPSTCRLRSANSLMAPGGRDAMKLSKKRRIPCLPR